MASSPSSSKAVTDLDVMLSTLSPYLDMTETFIFHTDRNARYGDLAILEPVATISESEGLTLVVPTSVAESEAKINGGSVDIDLEPSASPRMRRITLGVHSSLEGVGLTAAVSTELANEGISANMVAGYYHDHLFVPVADAERAVDSLVALADRSKKAMENKEDAAGKEEGANDDDAALWEGLAPLHVEHIVNHSESTFTVPFRIASKKFVIEQDLEGRRQAAFEQETATDENDDADDPEHLSKEDLTEHESKTGAVIWDGAVVAASVLERANTMVKSNAFGCRFREQLDPKNKSVVELGCGCSALPSQVSKALGAKRVVLTDLDVVIDSDLLRHNLQMNLSEQASDVRCLAYCWGDKPLPPEMKGAHLILATDCVYDIALVEPLLDSIEMVMNASARHSDNCVALVAFDTSIGRHKAYTLFEERANKRFGVYEVLGEHERVIRDDLGTDTVKAYVLAEPK